MIDQASLDQLWNFADPQGSETRFEVASAELATQAVRCLGLQGEFDRAHARLDEVAAGPGGHQPVVQARMALERGRLFNSAGDAPTAVTHFTAAAEQAAAAQLRFVQVDALHMLAIADPDHSAEHTAAALAVLDECSDERTQRWRVSLLNNAGWAHAEAGRIEQALASFRESREAALRWGTAQQVTWADEAIAEVSAADHSL